VGTTITRQALFDAVWAQPISKLSKEFGISDVGLAKACRKASVPIPPRGHWARKTAGKPVVQVALPPRPPGLAENATIGGGNDGWGWRGPPDEFFLGDIPPEPTFDEPIDEVRARIESMVGKTAIVERDLKQPHPVVATLLRKDDERRAKSAGQSYVASWERVLYDTPIQQRRLRLLSSILMTAGRCGCRGDLGLRPEMGQPQNDLSLIVGDQRVGFRVTVEENKPAKRGKSSDRKTATTVQVSLQGRVWDKRSVGCLEAAA
jgi:hypothetical protein